MLYHIVELISCAQRNHSENLVFFILWNGSKHLHPQRASAPRVSAGIVFPIGQSSRLAARDKSPPSSFTTWACGAQRCSRSVKTLPCSSPELSFIMSSSCEASSTCPIPSRSSWPPLPHSYSQTPGGTLFSTTPGGETTQCFFLNCGMYFITSDLVLHASVSTLLKCCFCVKGVDLLYCAIIKSLRQYDVYKRPVAFYTILWFTLHLQWGLNARLF